MGRWFSVKKLISYILHTMPLLLKCGVFFESLPDWQGLASCFEVSLAQTQLQNEDLKMQKDRVLYNFDFLNVNFVMSRLGQLINYFLFLSPPSCRYIPLEQRGTVPESFG